MFFNYRSKCEFCEKEHKDHCELAFPPDCTTLNDVIKKSDKRNLILVVQWRANPPARVEMIECPKVIQVYEDQT